MYVCLKKPVMDESNANDSQDSTLAFRIRESKLEDKILSYNHKILSTNVQLKKVNIIIAFNCMKPANLRVSDCINRTQVLMKSDQDHGKCTQNLL